ncbi:MAG: FAD-dependent oxidoreductase [Bacillota bacterium]
MSKNVIILGAGYGGVSAAKKLHKIFKRNDEVTITLIDKNPYHTLLTEIHEVAGNRIEEDAVKVDLDKLFYSTKVNLVKDNITDINLDNKRLKSSENEYSYDYLIMGTGSQPSDCGVEGVKEHTLSLWSIEDALKVKEKIEKSFQKARMTDNPIERKKLLSFVVCGGGFTGVEMVGELIDWVNEYCKKYNIARSEVELYNVEGLDDILPSLDDKSIKKAKKHLHKNDVRIKTGDFITKIEENKLTLENGDEIEANTIIWACGIEASQFAQNAGLETSKAKRVKVNKYLQTENHPEVYAIGDNSAAPWKDDQILPALVEAAQQTGECAADNIAADIKGYEKEEFEPNFHGIMVSIGSKYAVAEVMGMSMKGIPALFMKHMVNMYYRFEIGGIKEGFNFISNYLKEQGSKKGLVAQFFDHISYSTRTVFTVLLRIFAGVMWIYEGYTKIRDGWLASGDYLVSGSTASPIGDYAVDWYVTITENVVFQFPLLFQYLVVLGMIGMGISLIFGIFTTLGALGSAGMSINFLLAGQYPHFSSDFPGHFSPLYWMLFGSIALIGSGRSFGLDYYIIPWLKNLIWNRAKGKNKDLQKVVEKTNIEA